MNNGPTSKQEKFCITYVTEGGSLSDAYRAAYNCEKMKPESVNRKAAELMANGKISARISELRAEARHNAVVTVEEHFRELARLRDLAVETRQYGAAIKAETARGKVSGLYVDRQESRVDARVVYSWEND